MGTTKRDRPRGQVIIYSLMGAFILFVLYLPELLILNYAYTNILGGHIPPGIDVGDHLILFLGFPLMIGLGALFCSLSGLYGHGRKRIITKLIFCAFLAGGIGSFINAMITLILLVVGQGS